MNSERVTPKNAAKELQMDVITLRELMKREKLPIGYGLWVPLTPEHHRTGKISAHQSTEVQKLLQIIAQLSYELNEVSQGLTVDEARKKFFDRYRKFYI